MTWVANIAQIKNIWTPLFNLFLYWRPFYQSLANFDSTINDCPYLFNPFQGFSSHVSRHSSRGSQDHVWKRKCIMPDATYSHVRVSAAPVRCQHAACPQRALSACVWSLFYHRPHLLPLSRMKPLGLVYRRGYLPASLPLPLGSPSSGLSLLLQVESKAGLRVSGVLFPFSSPHLSTGTMTGPKAISVHWKLSSYPVTTTKKTQNLTQLIKYN